MTLIVGRDRTVWDGSGKNARKAVIKAGRHEVVTVQNPHDPLKQDWIVMKGTMVGAPKQWWDYLTSQANAFFNSTEEVTIKM